MSNYVNGRPTREGTRRLRQGDEVERKERILLSQESTQTAERSFCALHVLNLSHNIAFHFPSVQVHSAQKSGLSKGVSSCQRGERTRLTSQGGIPQYLQECPAGYVKLDR